MAVVSDKKVVSLKGLGDGLRLIIDPSYPQNKITDEATGLLKSASSIVDGSKITIDTGDGVIDRSFVLALLKNVIWPLSLNISVWKSDDPQSIMFLKKSGFSCYEKKPTTLKNMKNKNFSAFTVDKSLRSGQIIEQNRDVVVFGHVHDGAEVISTGNIFIFGRLRGLAHAGSDGNDNCFITTDSFMARQVRVGNKVSNELDPELQHWWECPVIISTDGDKLTVRKRV